MRALPGRIATLAVALVAGCSGLAAPAQQGERPSAMRLFPAETVLWVRTADAGLLVERLSGTSYGQMLRDPELASLVEGAYETAEAAYSTYARDVVDAELEELLNLPAGEVAFGMVNRHAQNLDPAILLIADFGDHAQVARRVVDRLQQLAEEDRGAQVTIEQLRSDEATVIRRGNDAGGAIAFVQRDATFVASNDPVLLQRTLDRWDGIPVEEIATLEEADAASDSEADNDAGAEPAGPPYLTTLAENPSFSATLREVMPGSEEPPQLLFYVEPITMVEAVGGRGLGTKIAMATFPSLGLDGVKALGGALWLATEKWDSLARGHLLLANPRSGAVKVARLETGETAPPDFVPAAIENFASLRIGPVRLFEDIVGLYDKFQFEGAFRNLIEKRVSAELGFDFEEEFVRNLTGSAFFISGFTEEGVRPAAQPCVAVGVLDQAAAEATLAKLAEEFSGRYEEATFGAATYYRFVPRPFRDVSPDERPFTPVQAVLDGHFLMCQSEGVFKQFVQARDGELPRLNESLQYRLVRSRLGRLTEGEPFSTMLYRDEEPVLRHLHRMATSDEARDRMSEVTEFVPWLGGVRDTLDGAEIPPVEVLLKYASPAGGAVVDTDTGWHFLAFRFQRAVQ
ncbi:MAG: hypothetical protein AAGB00_13375 [Planctomycetota bacterium]